MKQHILPWIVSGALAVVGIYGIIVVKTFKAPLGRLIHQEVEQFTPGIKIGDTVFNAVSMSMGSSTGSATYQNRSSRVQYGRIRLRIVSAPATESRGMASSTQWIGAATSTESTAPLARTFPSYFGVMPILEVATNTPGNVIYDTLFGGIGTGGASNTPGTALASVTGATTTPYSLNMARNVGVDEQPWPLREFPILPDQYVHLWIIDQSAVGGTHAACNSNANRGGVSGYQGQCEHATSTVRGYNVEATLFVEHVE